MTLVDTQPRAGAGYAPPTPAARSTDDVPVPAAGSVRRTTALLFALAAVLRLGVMAVWEGTVNDSTGRIIVALQQLRTPGGMLAMFGSQAWPDGNYYLPAAVLALGGDPYWAVRVLYALIGASNVVLLYRLARRLVDDRAAMVGAAILAVLPMHVAISADGAMGEVPAMSLVLAGLLFAWRLRDRVRLADVVAAGACFALATTFRYESAIWAALAGLVTLTPADRRWPTLREPRRLGAVVLLGALSATYLVALVIRWSVLHGDPFYYLSAAALNQSQLAGRGHGMPTIVFQTLAASFWVATTFAIVTPLAAALGFLGLARGWQRAASAPFVLVYALFLAYFAYASTRPVGIPLQYRYGLLIYAGVLPFVLPGLRWIAERWRALAPPLARLAVVTGVLAYAAYAYFGWTNTTGVLGRRLGPLTPFQPSQYAMRGVVRWLDSRPTDERRLIVSACAASPYLLLARRDLVEPQRVRSFPIYTGAWTIHTSASYADSLARTAAGYSYILFNTRCPGLGFTDALVDDPLAPPAGAAEYTTHGLTLTPAMRYDRLAVYRVRPATP